MNKAVITLILVLGAVVIAKAQTSINDYKYVVVPHFYEFVKGKDAYRLNTITRYLLRKNGLNALMEEEIKESDYKNNNCLALKADVINNNNLIRTKLTIVLTNCDGEIIFESKEGTSKSKDYETAYKEALNRAFESFEGIEYAYKPNKNITSRANKYESDTKATEAEKEVKKLKAEIQELKEEKEIAKVEVKEDAPLINAEQDEIRKAAKDYLKAKFIANGFELINSKSNTVEYVIHETSIPDVYIIKGKKGIVYKKGNEWIREHVDGEKTIVEVLDIRF